MRDDIDLEQFKKALGDRLEAIGSNQGSRGEEGSPVELDQSRVGRLSRMDAMQQQAMSRAAARLEELELQRIQAALRRIESGDYGYCTICGDEIAVGRLKFDPSVPTCIICAQQAEEK